MYVHVHTSLTPVCTCDSLVILAARKRDIDVKAKPRPRSNLLWTPSSREKCSIVVAMNRDVQNAGIVVEYVLGSIPMMNVLLHMMRKKTKI